MTTVIPLRTPGKMGSKDTSTKSLKLRTKANDLCPLGFMKKINLTNTNSLALKFYIFVVQFFSS